MSAKLGKQQRYLLAWLNHEFCNTDDWAFRAQDRKVLRSLERRGLVELEPEQWASPATWHLTDAGRKALGEGE